MRTIKKSLMILAILSTVSIASYLTVEGYCKNKRIARVMEYVTAMKFCSSPECLDTLLDQYDVERKADWCNKKFLKKN